MRREAGGGHLAWLDAERAGRIEVAQGREALASFANLFDGIARHSPEGLWFRQRAQDVGFKQAVQERDSGDAIAEGVSKRAEDLK